MKTNGYLWCMKKKNHPRVHISICEKCKYKKKCEEYRKFLEREVKK